MNKGFINIAKLTIWLFCGGFGAGLGGFKAFFSDFFYFSNFYPNIPHPWRLMLCPLLPTYGHVRGVAIWQFWVVLGGFWVVLGGFGWFWVVFVRFFSDFLLFYKY